MNPNPKAVEFAQSIIDQATALVGSGTLNPHEVAEAAFNAFLGMEIAMQAAAHQRKQQQPQLTAPAKVGFVH